MNKCWLSPVPHRLVVTKDSNSWKWLPKNETGVPIGDHCGAFAFERAHHIHEGVDLYVPQGTPVNTVAAGVVTAILPFTGPQIGQDWWHDTWAVFVEHEDGVVVYGEIQPLEDLKVGAHLLAGEVIGHVIQVLTKDKGRPTSMLHLELHAAKSTQVVEWVYSPQDVLLALRTGQFTQIMSPTIYKWMTKPPVLLDPTPFLIKTVETFYS